MKIVIWSRSNNQSVIIFTVPVFQELTQKAELRPSNHSFGYESAK